jgi:hypothetical protein
MEFAMRGWGTQTATMPEDFEFMEYMDAVGNNAFQSMFPASNNATFRVNAKCVLPFMTQELLNVQGVLASVFSSSATTDQGRTIASLIAHLPTPTVRKSTFGNNDTTGRQRWSDWDEVHENWR